jgi:hypothetical protein
LVIDSTGLNIFGKGEWKKQKHEPDKRQVWRMLHLTVDPTSHNIVAAEVSLENVHDTEVLPTLLNPLRRALGTVYADCGYDLKACHELIMRCWKEGLQLYHWKRISGYQLCSLAETVMLRFSS